MSKITKLKLSYNFFCEMEKRKRHFTLGDIVKSTGWSSQTVKAYACKKWEVFLRKQGREYFVDGLLNYKEEEYLRLMSQKDTISNNPLKPILPVEIERLVVKAKEAATLALDIYNRPATIFRTEGYSVMMVIAWTALFHAIFEKNEKSYIYYKNGIPEIIDGDPKSWDLSKCVAEYYGALTTPERKNLEFFIGLRNKIEHRFVPAIDPHVGGECQALLANFDELLTKEFGDFYALREHLSFPLQTSTLRRSSQTEIIRKFQGQQYDKIKDYIDAFRAELPDKIYQDPKYSFRIYLIPKIGNHKNSSDLAIEFIKYDLNNTEEVKALQKQVALIRDRKIPVANQGKLKPKDVSDLVSKKLQKPFNIHNHTQAWKKYGVRKSGENPEGCNIKYCQFDEVHKDYVYTTDWVNFLVDKLSDEKEYKSIIKYKW